MIPAGAVESDALVETVFGGLLDETATGDRVVVIDASRANDKTTPDWLALFRRLNERRNTLTQDFAQSLVLILSPPLEGEFARAALDLWSVRSVVIRIPDLIPVAQSEALLRSMDSGFGSDEDPDSLELELEQARTHASQGSPAARRALRVLLLRRSGGYLRRGQPEASEAALKEAEELVGDSNAANAAIAVARAQLLILRGELQEADALLVQTLSSEQQDSLWVRAEAWGYRAEILENRGDFEQALRIRREEQLPAFRRLGDTREVAITLGKISDILEYRGEFDEALRIRREEQLPVFHRLGDTRAAAVVVDGIADVLAYRGDFDEALRIRREETLPVYQRLGDVRSVAITMGKIASIVGRRGDSTEALRILREEVLPVLKRLGDLRSAANTMGKIADILEDRGDFTEALRVHREEVLPVYQRLGTASSLAVTMGRIADILEHRGDHDEALFIRREEELPAYQRLGALREAAICKAKTARLLLRVGRDWSEAPKLLAEARDTLRELDLPEAKQIERLASSHGIELD